jgi:hypothetical protein
MIKECKLVKNNIVYEPVTFKMPDGQMYEGFADKEKLDHGIPTAVLHFSEIVSEDGPTVIWVEES